MPLATNSRAHLYSNYFTATGNLATITVGNDAQVLSESNFFSGVNAVLVRSGSNALAKTDYNGFVGGVTPVSGTDRVFAPDYSYLMTWATSVRSLVTSNAGNTAGAASAAPVPAVTLLVSGTEGNLPDSVSFTLTSSLGGAQAVSYQWRRDNWRIMEGGNSYEGFDSPSLTVGYARAGLSGAYSLQAVLENGDIVVSNPKIITIGPPVPPQIIKQPFVVGAPDGQASWPVNLETPVSISVEAGGDPVLKYQWQRLKNAAYDSLPGATHPVLNLGPAAFDDGGVYRVQVVNNSGSATSADLTLIVTNPDSPYSVGAAGGSGPGGGGGAFSPWGIAARLHLAALRLKLAK
jgi:hypothetical protein